MKSTKNKMEEHFSLSDTAFKNQFIDCELNPALFTHEAHLRLAWININKYGIKRAEKEIQSQLQHFVEFVGAKDKYNKTVTIAAIKAVYHFMLKSKKDNFKDFIAEHPRLKTNFKDLLDCHYSFDVFNSNEAKMVYLEPDLVPFD